MGALNIRNVRKSYGSAEILKGINLEVNDGEFLILVGPSGCGKSTLLSAIAGLESVSSGEIAIGGRVVNDLPPKDRNIAMVFQSYALYPNMTVRGNIAFGLENRGMPRAEQEAIIARVARTLQLEPLLERKPSQLSGGQRQRVAMGRALAREPDIFLFDEPLSNLDAKLRVEMRTEIKQLHRRLATTIVYVTHDQIEAMTLGDRIAVMKDGEVQQFDTPQQIYQQPANLFVAGFIGSPSMNFIRTEVVAANGGIGVALSHHDDRGDDRWILPLPPTDGLESRINTEVILGIRPEQITAANEGSAHVRRCRIELTEPTGPDTLVLTRINNTSVVCRVAPQHAVRPGEYLDLEFETTKAVLFDSVSERRIA